VNKIEIRLVERKNGKYKNIEVYSEKAFENILNEAIIFGVENSGFFTRLNRLRLSINLSSFINVYLKQKFKRRLIENKNRGK